ncbi:MAG: hypothetical protein ABSE43_11660, partial [Steroidobacteraceae bacterium]
MLQRLGQEFQDRYRIWQRCSNPHLQQSSRRKSALVRQRTDAMARLAPNVIIQSVAVAMIAT